MVAIIFSPTVVINLYIIHGSYERSSHKQSLFKQLLITSNPNPEVDEISCLQYCDSNIGLFSIASHLVIALPTLRQQKLSLLISLLQFLYEFCRLVKASFLYCFSYSCRSFTLLKALAKSNSNHFAIAFKSKKERQLSLSIIQGSYERSSHKQSLFKQLLITSNPDPEVDQISWQQSSNIQTTFKVQ